VGLMGPPPDDPDAARRSAGRHAVGAATHGGGPVGGRVLDARTPAGTDVLLLSRSTSRRRQDARTEEATGA